LRTNTIAYKSEPIQLNTNEEPRKKVLCPARKKNEQNTCYPHIPSAAAGRAG